MSTITLRRGRDFGEIISDTFGYFRVHFKSLGKGLILFSLPMIILSGILIGSGFGESLEASTMQAGQEPPLNELASMGFKIMAGAFLLMITMVVIIQICFKHVQFIDEGIDTNEIEMGMLLEDFFRNFFGLIGLFIVIGVATMIGFLLLIIPGIYVATKLSLAPSIFIIENEDFGEALSRSWQVTQDNWWFTFGVSFVMSLIVNVITNIVVVPFYLIVMVVAFSSGSPDAGLFSTLFSIMYGLMMIMVGLLYCFPLISQAMVYFSLYEAKSGNTLSQRIDSLHNTYD